MGPARSPQQFFASASTVVAVAAAASSTALAAASDNNNNNNNNRNKDNTNNTNSTNTKTTTAVSGVYVRPSGAIERGSGFFVPGLEGPKVRVVIGMVLLVGTLVEHSTTGGLAGGGISTGMTASTTTTTATVAAWSLSDGIAILYSGVLLFQAAIEYTKETTLQLPAKSRRTTTPTTRIRTMHNTDSSTTNNTDAAAAAAAAASSAMVTQRWFPDRAAEESDDDEIRTRTTNAILVGDTTITMTSKKSDSYKTKIQWMAAAYVTMTPTTQMLLLVHTNHTRREADEGEGGGRVRYRIGPAALVGAGVDDREEGVRAPGVTAALQELQHSSGGRIAVPLQHPAVQALLFPEGGGGGTDDDPNTENNTAAAATAGRREEGSSSSHHHGVRTVILQRITVDSCWLVASDELLAKYTTNDLKWLGQLAQYAQVQEE